MGSFLGEKNCFFTWHIGLCLMPVNFVKLIARKGQGGSLQAPLPSPGASPSKLPSPPSPSPGAANGKRSQGPQARSAQTAPSPPGLFTANGPKAPRRIHRKRPQAPPRPIHRKRPQAPQPHLPQTVPGTPRHIHCKRCQAPQAHSPQMVPSASRRNSLSPGLKGNTPRPVISEHAKNIRIYN